MGCATSSTKVAEMSDEKQTADVMKTPPIKANGATSLKDKKSVDDCDVKMSAIDLEQPLAQQRKESSLPEVDKDLQMNGCEGDFIQEFHKENGRSSPDVDDISDKINEEERSESFDATAELLSREKIKSLRPHATQETLEFIYNNRTSSSPSHLGGTFPAFQNSPRHNNRRPSGVPPPARALKPDDFLARKASGVSKELSFFQEEEEEEEEESAKKITSEQSHDFQQQR